MQPITFSIEGKIAMPSEEIARQMLDLARWQEFRGYGPIPGIKTAEFEVKTPDVVGTRIRVTSMDGSRHVEEIGEWQPDRRIRLQMKEFSPPLSRLATEFEEIWEFRRVENETQVTRSFHLHARSMLTWPLLRVIAYFFKRAIARHVRGMTG